MEKACRRRESRRDAVPWKLQKVQKENSTLWWHQMFLYLVHDTVQLLYENTYCYLLSFQIKLLFLLFTFLIDLFCLWELEKDEVLLE